MFGLARLREPQRLALAAGPRQHVVLARIAQRLAAEREPHDLDRLAHARERLRERHAVQALDHLRARRTEPEDEAVARERGERDRGHRGHARRARADLEDPAAEHEPLGLRGEIGEDRDRVVAPRLRAPRRVDAELLRLDRERGQLRELARLARRGSADADRGLHARFSFERALEERQVVDAEVELAGEEDRRRAERAARDRLLGGGAQLVLHRRRSRRARERRRVETRAPRAPRRPRRRSRGRGPSPRTRDTPRRGTLRTRPPAAPRRRCASARAC